MTWRLGWYGGRRSDGGTIKRTRPNPIGPPSATATGGQAQQPTGQKPGARHGGPSRITDIHGAVTTKYNQVFMLCDGQGDIVPDDHGYGLYFRDMCYLDQLELRLCGQRPIPLLADASKGSQAVFELTNPHLRLLDGRPLPKERLSIRRSYMLHHRVTMQLEVHNLDRVPVALEVEMALGSHFQDMLVIRGFLKEPMKRGTLYDPEMKGRKLTFRYDGADHHHRTTTIEFKPKPDEVHGGQVL